MTAVLAGEPAFLFSSSSAAMASVVVPELVGKRR
jgi:hypothetical protein